MTVDLPVADMPVSNTRFTSASYESVRARNGGARARLRHASAQYARRSVDRLIPPGWRVLPVPDFPRPLLPPPRAGVGRRVPPAPIPRVLVQTPRGGAPAPPPPWPPKSPPP